MKNKEAEGEWVRYTVFMRSQMVKRLQVHAKHRRLTLKDLVDQIFTEYFEQVDKVVSTKRKVRIEKENSKGGLYPCRINAHMDKISYIVLQAHAEKMSRKRGGVVSVNAIMREIITRLLDSSGLEIEEEEGKGRK